MANLKRPIRVDFPFSDLDDLMRPIRVDFPISDQADLMRTIRVGFPFSDQADLVRTIRVDFSILGQADLMRRIPSIAASQASSTSPRSLICTLTDTYRTLEVLGDTEGMSFKVTHVRSRTKIDPRLPGYRDEMTFVRPLDWDPETIT